MTRAIIAFGANLGNPAETYSRACEFLSRTNGVASVAPSPLYRTDPVGGPDTHLVYLNGAVLVETSLLPADLYHELVDIQQRLGRTKREHWGPRPIDLDLVWIENTILVTDELTIPHPRMHYRWFVLQPAADVAQEALHPIFGVTIQNLLKRVAQQPRRFEFLGGSKNLLELIQKELESRFEAAATTHCPVPPPGITFHRLGNSVVGLSHPNDGVDPTALDVWRIVFAEDEPLPHDDASIIPAVDARGRDDQARLDNFRLFLDSLRPGSRFISNG